MESVLLNHIYLVTDKETYESIKNSDLVASLAHTYEQKNSADNQMGWEGLYLRGKETFIEIFYPQSRYPEVGISGIGMGVDEKGALSRISSKLMKADARFKRGAFERKGNPWFEYITLNDGCYYQNHSFWIMEYTNAEDVSRAHYNKEKYDPTKPFLDITSFSIALQPKGLEILSSCLSQCGLKVNSENSEIKLEQETNDFKGIYKINFSLSKECDKSYQKLGNSILSFEGYNGVWTFYAPK